MVSRHFWGFRDVVFGGGVVGSMVLTSINW